MKRPYKTGDMFATSGDTIISRAIRKATGGEVSHIAIVYDENYVIEARGDFPYHSVVKTPINELLRRSNRVYLIAIGIPKINENKAKEWLLSKVGVKYDYFNTVVIQMARIFGLRKLFQRRIERAERKYMCSELAVHFQKANRNLFKYWPKKSYNPQEVLNHFSHYAELIKG